VTYRSDIDGLRAIAVIAVILFHAGIGGFSGGYVGVDVFFVISGFLITRILRKDHEAGRFSIARFYERRARRILPALLVVLLATLAGGYVFLLPFQYGDLGKSTLATLAFVSNIKFWRGAGYFDGAAEFTSLLHTWSLAVEEQFYIIFPLVLGVLLRIHPKWLGRLVAVTALLSLLLSTVGVYLSPSATFYLIPTRAWELLIGAALALDLVPRVRSPAAREWLAAGGLVAILAAVAFYTPLTHFPGASALLPCVGTALILHAGRDRPGFVARLLGAKVPVFVGLISYSLYLYHFPIFVFARFWTAGELAAPTILGCIILTFVLATLSWRFVERPFRQSGHFTRNQIFAASIAGSAFIAALALVIVVGRGMPYRFDARTLALAAGADDFDPTRRQCINVALDRAPTDPACAVGSAARRMGMGRFVLWGDSHAAAMATAVDLAADRVRVGGTLVSFNACPPLLGVAGPRLSWKDQQSCLARNAALVERVRADPAIQTVVMTAFWSAYFDPAKPDDTRRLGVALRATLDELGGKRVIFLLDTPRAPSDLPWALALSRHFGRAPPTLISGDNDLVVRVAGSVGGKAVTVVSTSSLFCRSPGGCALFANGRPILSDSNHVGATTARALIGPYLASLNMFGAISPGPELDRVAGAPTYANAAD
jgi:peptidoglycan/LPS O-acetylase OafA/YrhL